MRSTSLQPSKQSDALKRFAPPSELSNQIFLINTQIEILSRYFYSIVNDINSDNYLFILTLAAFLEQRADMYFDYVATNSLSIEAQEKIYAFADTDYHHAMMLCELTLSFLTQEELTNYGIKIVELHFSRIDILEEKINLHAEQTHNRHSILKNYIDSTNLMNWIEAISDRQLNTHYRRLLRSHLHNAEKKRKSPDEGKNHDLDTKHKQLTDRRSHDMRLMPAPKKRRLTVESEQRKSRYSFS